MSISSAVQHSTDMLDEARRFIEKAHGGRDGWSSTEILMSDVRNLDRLRALLFSVQELLNGQTAVERALILVEEANHENASDQRDDLIASQVHIDYAMKSLYAASASLLDAAYSVKGIVHGYLPSLLPEVPAPSTEGKADASEG